MDWIKNMFLNSTDNTNVTNLQFEKIKSKCYQCGGSGFIIRKEPFRCIN